MSSVVSNHRFIDDVKEAIHSGHGLVPFIGSGISAPSGILMGMQFGEYVAWTVYRCVSGEEIRPSTDEGGVNPETYWNLDAKGWPPSPKADETRRATEWIKKEFIRLCRKYGTTLVLESTKATETQPIVIDSFDEVRGDKIVRFGFVGSANQSKSPGDPTNPHDLNRSLRRPLIPDVLTGHFKDATSLDKPIREFWQAVDKDEVVQRHQPAQMESSTSKEFLIEAAIRALADWTSALDFLARLKWLSADGSK